MLSSRSCLLFRFANSNSSTSHRFAIRFCSKGIPKVSSNGGDQHKKFADDGANGKSSFGQARAKFEPLVKANDLVKENIFTIPNALCLSRIALSPLLAYSIVHGNYSFGLGIFAYAAVTDLMDGWIARTFPSQQSVLGSALDPVADKVLVSVLVLSLTYVGLIPLPLTVLIIVRDVGLLTAGFAMRYITLEPPKTFSRYFDITAPSVRMKPTGISKVNTAVQLCMVGVSLAAPIFQYVNHPALYAVWWLTAGTTIASGMSYVFAKDTYEVLKKRTKRESDNG